MAEERGASFSAFVSEAAIQAAQGDYSPANNIAELKLSEIRMDPATNIRVSRDADEELVASVRAQGILEPLRVRRPVHAVIVGIVDAVECE